MYSNFEQDTDEVLIDRLRDGEKLVIDYLMDKYKNLVKHKAKSMYILGADTEDLIQEGMIGLFKAVRDYDCGRDASFYTFAELCVSRQMYTAVQAAQRKKHLPLNSYISLNSESKDKDAPTELLDVLQAGQNVNPETLFLDKERMEYLENQIEKELSDFERQALELYLTGMSYSQVAKVLCRDEKSTDNALQRVKMKIKKILKN